MATNSWFLLLGLVLCYGCKYLSYARINSTCAYKCL